MNGVEFRGISHFYGHNKAVDQVNFSLAKGHIFALLGPNGAGKTTLIKILIGLLKPTQGECFVWGQPAGEFSHRKRLAYLPEKFNFYPFYTIEKALTFIGRLRGVTTEEMSERLDFACDKFQVQDIRTKKLQELSKGQLQRVGLASLLMGEADLYLLDEPFSGLDPIAIRLVKDALKDLGKQGKTIFVNTHLINEAQTFVDSFAVLYKGQLMAQKELSDLTNGESIEDFFMDTIKG